MGSQAAENYTYFRFYVKFGWHWLLCLCILSMYLLLTYVGPQIDGCERGSTTVGCNAGNVLLADV
jgi:hypothetical protein